MRLREKLTVEEKVAIALELIKRERSLDEIRVHYRVSHTTAYKLRNLFLEGGRRALSRGEYGDGGRDLEARVKAIEQRLDRESSHGRGNGRARTSTRSRVTTTTTASEM
ncbi:MAG: hypothetical protein SF182_06755 [Deltaproteobacteria bacterium]|nr:hypothetical protein [Deltaproteobacteria bacterium]